MAPVPDPRQLGLQDGISSSHACPCPHPCPWGDAGGFSPPQGWLQHPAWGRGTPALPAAADCSGISRAGKTAGQQHCRKANDCQLALVSPGWWLAGLMQQVMGFAAQLEGESLDFTHPHTMQLPVSWPSYV